MQVLRFKEKILKTGEIHLSNLPVVKGQQVELLVLIPPKQTKKRLTARELLDSDLIGLWENRTDIIDSAAYARQLRERAQRRRQ
ncbi:MAG: hypothetical protein GXP42_02865 [Chloroflexi bacterium]|nr:hypothetical protein [Chloroflexota bacterium]